MKTKTLILGCLTYLMLGFSLFAGDDKMTVEVLIYSGRPNPTWEITDTNELQALTRQLRELPEIAEQPLGWSRLGFQGFIIRGVKASGLPNEIRVFHGVIGVRTGQQMKYLKDKNGVEQRLIADAQKQQLANHVKEAITKHDK